MTKASEILFKTGNKLISIGIDWCQSAKKEQTTQVGSTELKNLLKPLLGLTDSQIYCADSKYFIPETDFTFKIIEWSLLDLLIYYSDYSDCDNYAYLFSALPPFLYGINSFGKATGNLYSPITGKKIGRHAYNCLVTKGIKGYEVYIYEPMNDKSYKISSAGQKVVLGNCEYRTDSLHFF